MRLLRAAALFAGWPLTLCFRRLRPARLPGRPPPGQRPAPGPHPATPVGHDLGTPLLQVLDGGGNSGRHRAGLALRGEAVHIDDLVTVLDHDGGAAVPALTGGALDPRARAEARETPTALRTGNPEAVIGHPPVPNGARAHAEPARVLPELRGSSPERNGFLIERLTDPGPETPRATGVPEAITPPRRRWRPVSSAPPPMPGAGPIPRPATALARMAFACREAGSPSYHGRSGEGTTRAYSLRPTPRPRPASAR